VLNVQIRGRREVVGSGEAIINLDAISLVTKVYEPDGTESTKLHMLGGAEIVISNSFGSLQNALQAMSLSRSP
jgi:hypothetical protein